MYPGGRKDEDLGGGASSGSGRDSQRAEARASKLPTKKKPVPEQLGKKIEKLISTYPGGVLITKLATLYTVRGERDKRKKMLGDFERL